MKDIDIIEVLLHSSSKPLTQKAIDYVFKDRKVSLHKVVEKINENYNETNKGYSIERVSGGFQILSKSKYHHYIERLDRENRKPRFSKAALESLSIIAYKQPITKSEIEHIRGVGSSGVIKTLLEKGLITVKGRDEGLGKALLYGTTSIFLELFGLNSIKDLPTLDELTELMDKHSNID